MNAKPRKPRLESDGPRLPDGLNNFNELSTGIDRSELCHDAEARALIDGIIENLLKFLDTREADIFRRAEFLGQSIATIAEATGLSETEVSGLLEESRRSLMGLLTLTLQTPKNV
ncbi:MAG: hypothetical protein ACC631_00775 [Halocynthiibacter sp.]